jgi:hypothetical protein
MVTPEALARGEHPPEVEIFAVVGDMPATVEEHHEQ